MCAGGLSEKQTAVRSTPNGANARRLPLPRMLSRRCCGDIARISSGTDGVG